MKNTKTIVSVIVVLVVVAIGYIWFSSPKKSTLSDSITATSTDSTESAVATTTNTVVDTSSASTTVVTIDDNNKTVAVHVGDTVVVSLGSMSWSIASAPSGIIVPDFNAVPPAGAQVVMTAKKAGTTILTAEGRANCKAGEACPQFIVLVKTTIVVQ